MSPADARSRTSRRPRRWIEAVDVAHSPCRRFVVGGSCTSRTCRQRGAASRATPGSSTSCAPSTTSTGKAPVARPVSAPSRTARPVTSGPALQPHVATSSSRTGVSPPNAQAMPSGTSVMVRDPSTVPAVKRSTRRMAPSTSSAPPPHADVTATRARVTSLPSKNMRVTTPVTGRDLPLRRACLGDPLPLVDAPEQHTPN